MRADMLLSVRALCEGVQDGLHLGQRCREVASRIDAQRVWPHARAPKNELPVGFESDDNRVGIGLKHNHTARGDDLQDTFWVLHHSPPTETDYGLVSAGKSRSLLVYL